MTYLLKIFCFLTRPTEYQTCKNVFFTPFANLGQIFLGNESGEFSRVNDIHPVSFVLVGGCQIYSALKVKNPTPLLPFPLFSPRFPTSIITLISSPHSQPHTHIIALTERHIILCTAWNECQGGKGIGTRARVHGDEHGAFKTSFHSNCADIDMVLNVHKLELSKSNFWIPSKVLGEISHYGSFSPTVLQQHGWLRFLSPLGGFKKPTRCPQIDNPSAKPFITKSYLYLEIDLSHTGPRGERQRKELPF
jgi:hypothetical protein